MWKVYKYTLLDLVRNRFAIGYAALLVVVSIVLFMLEADDTKALVTLAQVMLALTPLLAMVFTIIYTYNQYEFTVLLAVQPLKRTTILRAQFFAISTALAGAYLRGQPHSEPSAWTEPPSWSAPAASSAAMPPAS